MSSPTLIPVRHRDDLRTEEALPQEKGHGSALRRQAAEFAQAGSNGHVKNKTIGVGRMRFDANAEKAGDKGSALPSVVSLLHAACRYDPMVIAICFAVARHLRPLLPPGG